MRVPSRWRPYRGNGRLTLTPAQLRVLRLAAAGHIVAVWHSDHDFPGLGLKPWYALSSGPLPTQLHSLWLDGLLRLDRNPGAPLKIDGHVNGQHALVVGRARLTPLGRRRLGTA